MKVIEGEAEKNYNDNEEKITWFVIIILIN